MLILMRPSSRTLALGERSSVIEFPHVCTLGTYNAKRSHASFAKMTLFPNSIGSFATSMQTNFHTYTQTSTRIHTLSHTHFLNLISPCTLPFCGHHTTSRSRKWRAKFELQATISTNMHGIHWQQPMVSEMLQLM